MNALTRLKIWLGDFPGHNASVAVALFLILTTGLTVIGMLILGRIFPAGYDTWIWALVALAGVNVAGMIGKRATDIGYKAAGPSPITVEAPSTVTVTPTTTEVEPKADL